MISDVGPRLTAAQREYDEIERELLRKLFAASGLVKHRADLAGDTEKAHKSHRTMVLHADNLDATILQFEPDLWVKTSSRRRSARKGWANRGKMTRISRRILSQASWVLARCGWGAR